MKRSLAVRSIITSGISAVKLSSITGSLLSGRFMKPLTFSSI